MGWGLVLGLWSGAGWHLCWNLEKLGTMRDSVWAQRNGGGMWLMLLLTGTVWDGDSAGV